MVIIRLKGGLGNQMFQYAFGRICALKNKTILKIDLRFFFIDKATIGHIPRNFELNVFKNNYVQATDNDLDSFFKLSKINKFRKMIGVNYPKIYNESDFSFQTEVLTILPQVFFNGYFQSYRYFDGYEDFITNLFQFPIDDFDVINKEILKKIKSCETISIHIRRGDYVHNKKVNEIHGTCAMEYYLNAIDFFSSIKKDFTLVFFSDESDWVKEEFKDLPYNKIFIDNNKDKDSWKDMFLMSICNHNIIANSSFSWWGAFLNKNKNKIVIAPKIWFSNKQENAKTTDLLPPSWKRM